MPNPHSSVKYVEPNDVNTFDKGVIPDGQFYDRAPNLEDYSIYLDIEVELSSREDALRRKEPGNNVIIMSYRSGGSEGQRDRVNFMSGSKIVGITTPNMLTTKYADMFITDLVDYGTTEMLGIKSVDIQYDSTCVPIITIKFTDVRGMSLFQPSELNNNKTYNAIRGFTKDNIAQSFFHSFFVLPLPKFTIHLKGFYGKMVSYEVMCEKFDAAFNSSTGDFDVTARFIGFAYSFMSDISFDALLAAPYSDYVGEKYWKDNVASGRFTLPSKDGQSTNPMPTLYEIRSFFKTLLNDSDKEMQETTLSAEEKGHDIEISSLNELKNKFRRWYDELYTLTAKKYGKDCVYLYGGENENDDYRRLIILTNGKNISGNNLSQEFLQYSDEFKKTNSDLYNSVEHYNESDDVHNKLTNVSTDFSKYTKTKVFKDLWYNSNTEKIVFDGFYPNNTLPREETINVIFTEKREGDDVVNKEKDEIYWNKKLSMIYNDGTNQYVDAFVVEQDYSSVTRRINALIEDANKSSEEAAKEKQLKEFNRHMFEKMGWYPTIENTTKIVMAHLETLMAMMFDVIENTTGRTPQDLGVTIGKDAELCDVNSSVNIVPPFPRVTKLVTDADGITTREDVWVGDFRNGIGFREVEIVNGLFNGVSRIKEMEDAINATLNEQERATKEAEEGLNPIVSYPLSPFDFFIKKNPYGDESDISNDKDAFAGKICMRMFDLLSISASRNEHKDNWLALVQNIAVAEAENFYKFVKMTNVRLTQQLGQGGAISNGDAIIPIVTGMEEHPWNPNGNNDRMLFDKGDGFWLNRYSTVSKTPKTYIYPIQNMSFSRLDESLKIFEGGLVDMENEDISISSVNEDSYTDILTSALNSLSKDSLFNTAFIGKYNGAITTALNNALAASTDTNKSAEAYKAVAETLLTSAKLNADDSDYKALFNMKSGFISSFNARIVTSNFDGKTEFKGAVNEDKPLYVGDGDTKEEYSCSPDALSDYFSSEILGDDINSGTITEVFGFKRNENGFYVIDKNKSLFLTDEYYELNSWMTSWGYTFSKADVQAAFFIMGIDCFSYAGNSLHLSKTFCNIPNLLALQIGVVLAADASITVTNNNGVARQFTEKSFNEIRSARIHVSERFEKGMTKFLNTLSPIARIEFIKYFLIWSKAYKAQQQFHISKDKGYYGTGRSGLYSAIFNKDANNNTTVDKRALLNQDSEPVKRLTNNLMLPVMFIRGNINAMRQEDGKQLPRKDFSIDESQVKVYLDSFLARLRELIGMPPVETDNITTLARPASQTNKDMKIELYRYLKQVFDKWIPTTKKSDWNYETFFENGANTDIATSATSEGQKDSLEETRETDGGHIFHFIDSYYNKVGSKLLINPQRLADSIKISTTYTDTNIMLYNFLADLYGGHRCMMKCIQNFRDLSKGMDDMFKPVPYMKMGRPKRFADFVVIYTYAPSKNLNVANSEFNDDGFMLNDELETPLAIRSRGESSDDSVEGGTYYKIPAFGVSYGRQYQSYFKNINVDMSNPVMTQQAIAAKHSILLGSRNDQRKIVTAQDLYDVYANQSYTCTVEMMGCAWVQPLMYFVLLNIPMFRGSYLIMKVTHRITPGNMVTTLTGCRMANVSNRLIEDIFSDETNENNEQGLSSGGEDYSRADIDNDCPYKVFPISEDVSNATKSSGVELKMSQSDKEKGLSVMEKLINRGASPCFAAGVAGNMFKESRYDPSIVNPNDKGYLSGGLCQWRAGNLLALIEETPGRFGQIKEGKSGLGAKSGKNSFVKNKLNNLGIDGQVKFLIDTLTNPSRKTNWVKEGYNLDKFNKIQNPEEAAKKFREIYEISEHTDPERWKAANTIYNYYVESGQGGQITQGSNNGDTHDTKNFAQLFFNALQKSAWSAPSSSVKLKPEIEGNVIVVKQEDGKSDKLPNIFDIILNGYYDNVQELYWTYNNSWSNSENPMQITVVVSEKVNIAQRKIRIVKYKDVSSLNKPFTSNDVPKGQVNDKFLESIAKRYDDIVNNKTFLKEVEQFFKLTEDEKKEMFKEHIPSECNTCGNGGDGTSQPSKGSEVVPSAKITIDGWDVEKTVNWINTYSRDCGDCACKNGSPRGNKGCRGLCATYVEEAIKAGGGPLEKRIHCNENNAPNTHATNLRYYGILESHGFVKIKEGTVGAYGKVDMSLQPGDVAIIGPKSNGHFHACLWNGSQWVSDFKQKGCNVYNSTEPYAIYRFHNKKGTPK